MAELQKQYQEKQDQKEELKRKAEHTELMLDRAAKLVSGRSILKRLYCRNVHGFIMFSLSTNSNVNWNIIQVTPIQSDLELMSQLSIIN